MLEETLVNTHWLALVSKAQKVAGKNLVDLKTKSSLWDTPEMNQN